jgi:site-specific recombinase XerD
MALTIFRRHLKRCAQTDRYFRRCSCPISVEGTLAGEEVRKALNLTSWEAAQNLIAEWNRAGKIGAELQKKKTPAEAIAAFLLDAEARNLADATVALYRRFLEGHFLKWCEERKVPEVRKLDVDLVRKYRESWTWAPVTSARRLERLRTFLAFCVDSGWMERNPAKVLKPPKVKGTSKMPFTEEEVRRIVAACDKLVTRGRYGTVENTVRVKAFILILRYTGLRISDAAKLDTSRVEGGRVFLRTEKTGTLVWVPIPDFVSDILSKVPRHRNYYFQTGNAAEKTVRGSWDRTLRLVLKLAKVDHGSAHVFRHTLATDLLSKGVPVETVATILGNSPAIVLKHYAPWVKSRQEALETAIRAVWDEEPKLKVIQGGGA